MNIAIVRAKNELGKCSKLENFLIEPETILEWNVQFTPGTDFFKGTYEFKVTIPTDYPFSPPHIKFTSDVSHPNIDYTGKICLGALAEWKASYTMVTIFNAIQSIFIEPNLNDPVNIDALKLWLSKN